MGKQEFIDHIKQMGVNEATFTFALNCYELGEMAERELCARLCEDSVEYAGGELASQIRKRGEK